MINAHDFYVVMSAVVPLYVAMFLAYGSVRWWKILTPDQCGGINRFVAIFAVPLLSFQILANNDPYKMNAQFIAADVLQKLAILALLLVWLRYSSTASFEWCITLFMLATLPNTLVMGIPLLAAMYGVESGSLVVQAVVLQCIIWYTLLLVFYEYRAARNLIRENFPKTAGSIVSVKVESDVVSLDGNYSKEPVQADADIGEDGKIHVVVRRSISTTTPRPSNLTAAEIYSIHSSRTLTPRESSFNLNEYSTMMMCPAFNNPMRPSNLTASDIYSLHSSRGPTPRTSNFNMDEHAVRSSLNKGGPGASPLAPPAPVPARCSTTNNVAGNNINNNNSINLNMNTMGGSNNNNGPGNKNDMLHMFVWSSTGSPISEGNVKMLNEDFRSNVRLVVDDEQRGVEDMTGSANNPPPAPPNPGLMIPKTPEHQQEATEMPSMGVMTRLILDMVWRKLIRNPNTYSSLLGLTWALVSYKWHVKMPAILDNSIQILSKAGLGMAMFSLGLFMALQKRILVCGTSLALFGMLVRFVTGPAVMAATSIAVGLRGVNLHVSIVQASLPQGIVPFVFAKEYNVHPDVLSTAVIFGMLVAFPITMLYYVLLGL